MTPDMWLTLAILIAAIVLFITEWLRVDVVAFGVVVLLMLSGVLEVGEALAGFSSTVVMTIAALFIVGGAVFQTGLAATIGQRILRIAGTGETRLIVVIMLSVAVMSGFMSDTGVVAVMLPAIISVAASAKISPSKLLLPLAYGSLLGGAATLIGTPPNIVVADLLRSEGLEPFGFFSYTPMGVILTISGIFFMVLVGRHLLPDHRPQRDAQDVNTPEELIELYRLPDNLFRVRVRRASPLIGQTLSESRLGRDFELNVLEIERYAPPRTVARLGEQSLVLESSRSEQILAIENPALLPNDILTIQGQYTDLTRATASLMLAILPISAQDADRLVSEELGIAEVLLPPRSSLIGKNLRELRFGSTYKLTVLDIRRPGVDDKLNLKDTALSFGDTLLVQGEWRNIYALRRQRRDFIVVGDPDGAAGVLNRDKAPLALLVLLGMLVLLVTGILPVAAASMLAGLAMVLTGCLSMDEAYDAIDWKSIVLIAGMLPMSTALEKVGLVEVVASGFTTSLGAFGPRIVLVGLFLLTTVFTQVLSNTATAVLIAPIALATANRLGIAPYAFLMAVALAASMAFASPVASPVNTLVMGAGSYRFKDYARAGGLMILLGLVISTLGLPLLFPF